jgi:hypothetical protein
MPCIGTVDAYRAIPACRDGYRVKVYVNDGGIVVIVIVVIRVSLVVPRQMHVLVWRHKERQQQGERHWYQRKAVSHHAIMHQPCDPKCKMNVKTSRGGSCGDSWLVTEIFTITCSSADWRALDFTASVDLSVPTRPSRCGFMQT